MNENSNIPTNENNINKNKISQLLKDLKEMIKKTYFSRNNTESKTSSSSLTSTTTTSNKQLTKHSILIENIKKLFSKLKKILLAVGIGLLAVLVILILGYFTKIDRKIFTLSINGYIKDSITGNGIEKALIKVNNSTYTSDNQGRFYIRDYFDDTINLSVTAEGYKDLTQTITLERNFLVFDFNAEIKLDPTQTGIVKGRLISETPYKFSADKIYINLDEVHINDDGTFTASNIKKGDILFEYQSLNFNDIEKTITIKEGENILSDINVKPTGDILGTFKDWINESTPITAKIEITNVAKEQISVAANGDFKIKDLEIGREYSIRISDPKYLTRDYKVKVIQGANQIFNLRMIPNDISASYLKKINNYNQVFRSDLDGQNEEQITNIKNFKPSPLTQDKLKVFLRADYERVRGLSSSILNLGYELSLSDNSLTRITTNTEGLQNLYYFYKAKKLINIVVARSNKNTVYTLELREIDGTNPIEVISDLDLDFTNLLVSNNGIVFYTLRKPNTKIDDLYEWNQETKESTLLLTEEEISLYDVSSKGKDLLLTRKNSNTGFEDLVVYDLPTSTTKTLLQNHDGNNYTFDSDSEDIFYFYAKRDGRTNLFKYDLQANETTRITFLDADEKFSDFSIIDRYIFYTLDDKLYVLDKNIPLNYKLVTEGISN